MEKIRDAKKIFELDNIANVDIDSKDRINLHREIIKSKPIMLEVFTEIHDLFYNLDQRYFDNDGQVDRIGWVHFQLRKLIMKLFLLIY